MNSIPYAEEIEKGLIVGVLTDPRILTKIQDKVSSADFYKFYHQKIFATIESLPIDKIDSLTVEERITDQEVKDYFKTLVADSEQLLPTLSNIIYYAETVRDKSKLRAGINLGQEITAQCFQPNADAEEVLANLEQLFAKFIKERVLQSKEETTQEAFRTFVENLGVIREDTGTRTGFYDLDLMLHKLEGLTVLAAQTSVGKTAFALNIARNVAREKPVLFFSLEQTEKQLFERLLSAEAEINSEEIRTQAFLADKMGQAIILAASESVQNALGRLFIDDTANVSTQYISSVARQKFVEYGSLGLIIVDYLHIMRLNDKKNSVEGLGDAVKELRALGKELNCPVILLSQLRRKQQSDGKESTKRPDLSDLRQSGEIEQSADVVLFLYRSSYFNQNGIIPDRDIVEVIIRKNRNGRTGVVELEWLPKFTKFKDR